MDYTITSPPLSPPPLLLLSSPFHLLLSPPPLPLYLLLSSSSPPPFTSSPSPFHLLSSPLSPLPLPLSPPPPLSPFYPTTAPARFSEQTYSFWGYVWVHLDNFLNPLYSTKTCQDMLTPTTDIPHLR